MALYSIYPFDAVLATLNLTRFRVGGWAAFIKDLVSSPLNRAHPSLEELTQCWMGCPGVFDHTDLVAFYRYHLPVMLLASPFDIRPLGRPLPDVKSTCVCSTTSSNFSSKIWVVKHNACDGKPVKEVEVSASCSCCHRTWCLPSSEMQGIVRHVAGRYSVSLPLDLD